MFFEKNRYVIFLKEVLNEKFDEFIFFNYGVDTVAFYNLMVRNNINLRVSCIEEGILSYNSQFDNDHGKIVEISHYTRKILKRKTLKDNLHNFYCYYPILYRGNLVPVQIPRISVEAKITGMRIKELGLGNQYLEQLEKRIPSVSKVTSSDWLFNSLMVDMLSEDGKAVGIMTNGSTWNQSDSAIRSYFIENGLIECVIALPARLFAGTAIATSMIVFSRNNKGVRLVDASELFVEGRRVNELSYENIFLIINATKNDSDISMYVSVEQLRDNDYVLSMNRYIVHDVADGMAFGDVIKRITRGAQLNAKALDEITTTVPTDMQYLMLANIKNGLIDKELPYLKSIDKKNDKYCLSNHCLILSKNGYPYKIAVAEVKEGQRILGNGNLYIIELDEEKADPYYLAAFFVSEQGTAALRSITVGATIPNIGVEQLTKLVIPIPSIEKQKEIADKYKTVKDEITMLQLKLEKAKNRMAHIIEEGGTNNA